MFDTFAYLITSLRKDFTEFCNEKLQEMGLTQGLLFFILYAGKHPQCSPKELTEALHMDTGYCARSDWQNWRKKVFWCRKEILLTAEPEW